MGVVIHYKDKNLSEYLRLTSECEAWACCYCATENMRLLLVLSSHILNGQSICQRFTAIPAQMLRRSSQWLFLLDCICRAVPYKKIRWRFESLNHTLKFLLGHRTNPRIRHTVPVNPALKWCNAYV